MANRDRFPNPRFGEIVKMADVLGVDRVRFLAIYCEHQCGPQPKLPSKADRLSLMAPRPAAETAIKRRPGRPKADQ